MRLQETTAALNALSYPTTTLEIISTIGDQELSLPDGTESLAEIFTRSDTDTFESPDDAHLTLYASVGDKAIGRKQYSDRDPPTREEIEPVSF